VIDETTEKEELQTSTVVDETVDSGLSTVDNIETETAKKEETMVEHIPPPVPEIKVEEKAEDRPVHPDDLILAEILKTKEEREKRRLGIYEEEKTETPSEEEQTVEK